MGNRMQSHTRRATPHSADSSRSGNGFPCGSPCPQHRAAVILSPVPTDSAVPGPLDEVSLAIIEQLQQDGRRSFAAISKAVGLSEAAVRQRVAKMVDSGIMQIVAVTDPSHLGYTRVAMIGVTLSGDIDEAVEAIAAYPEVDYAVVTAGSFDLLVEVVCADDDHLLSLINTRIRTLPAVLRTETFMYLKLRKQTYTWGPR